MKTQSSNLFLIAIGTIMIMIGVFRTYPISINKQFLWGNLPPVIVLICMVVITLRVGGMKFVMAGIDGTTKTTSSFLLTLITLMPLVAFGSVVAHHFEHSIAEALRGKAGFFWAIVSAFTAPGGNSLAGIVNRLWVTQRDLHPTLLYFMCVVPLISFTIFIIRKLGLNADIANAMYKTNWIIAITLAPVFWIYQKFFFK